MMMKIYDTYIYFFSNLNKEKGSTFVSQHCYYNKFEVT